MERQGSALESMSRVLSEHAAQVRWSVLPRDVQEAGIWTTFNTLSVAVGGSAHPVVQAMVGASPTKRSRRGGAGRRLGEGSFVGTSWFGPVGQCALVNGAAAHVEDFDDTHLDTVLHPGAPVVSAALAAAELSQASGEAFLSGVVAGVELGCRVALALGPSHFDRGWHVTGTAGHVAAAAAASRTLGASPGQMLGAIGIAATQAAGLQENFGSGTKCVHAGKAAMDGLEAAVLAAHGLSGPDRPLEGRRGLLQLESDPDDSCWQRAMSGIGEEWETRANAFKPYPCGIVSHPVIDAGLELGVAYGHDVGKVTRAEVHVNPIVLDVMGRREPASGLESKFSVYHCFAVSFLEGCAGPEQFGDACVLRDDVVSLRRRVVVVPEEQLRRDACWVRLVSSDGEIECHVTNAVGSVSNPMTPAALMAKAHICCDRVLGAGNVDGLLATVQALPGADSVSHLVDAAAPLWYSNT